MTAYCDKIFLTNLPSFYKIRLYNEISKKIKILVIFTDSSEKSRNDDFYNEQTDFEYIILKGSILSKIKQTVRIIKKTQYKELIINGWDSKIFWAASFCSPRSKNSLAIESSIYESAVSGIKASIKKMFLTRISKAYPSGQPHKRLLEALSFRGDIRIQGGVGLINLCPQPKYKPRDEVKRFLYVGRLIEVKNLQLLTDVFGEMPNLQLNIIGFGELEDRLKASAGYDNIHFIGAVPNKDLSTFYQSNDVFILPSKSETWGLVIDEALNNGMPVIVSDKVGCGEDLVSEETGLVFRYDDKDDLKAAIIRMTDTEFYNKLRLGVSKMDWAERQQKQIEVFGE